MTSAVSEMPVRSGRNRAVRGLAVAGLWLWCGLSALMFLGQGAAVVANCPSSAYRCDSPWLQPQALWFTALWVLIAGAWGTWMTLSPRPGRWIWWFAALVLVHVPYLALSELTRS